MYKVSGWELTCLYSDGVASIKKSLFQVIQEIVEDKVSDEMLRLASSKYPHCTPKTKEAFYYRYLKYVLLINCGSFLWKYIFILVLFLIITLLYYTFWASEKNVHVSNYNSLIDITHKDLVHQVIVGLL